MRVREAEVDWTLPLNLRDTEDEAPCAGLTVLTQEIRSVSLLANIAGVFLFLRTVYFNVDI